MRFDQVRVRLEPLTGSNCTDLAVLFLARHLKAVADLTATFALPCCAAVYYLAYEYAFDLRFGLILFYVASSPLGVLLTVGTASASFGESFTWPGLLKQNTPATLRLVLQGLLIRAGVGMVLVLFLLDDWPGGLRVLIGIVLCLFPGLWLAMRTGFITERGTLRRLSHHLHDSRGATLIRKQSGDLFLRVVLVFLFCSLLWGSLFISLDLAIDFLFHVPIFMSRLGPEMSDFGFLVWRDPKVLTLITFCGFIVYPLGRIAWFFCYVDLRVRRDCWDMELELTREAERLEGSA